MDYILYMFHPPCTKLGVHENRDSQALAIKEISYNTDVSIKN